MISFLVTVCNEHEEVQNLLERLIEFKDDEEEIVVLCDSINVTQEVRDVLDQFEDSIRVVEHPFENDFAKFKNFGNSQCKKEWIMQLDADELLDSWTQQSLRQICELNTNDTELIFFPRVNTVDGLTLKHVKEWKWSISKSELHIHAKSFPVDSEELKLLRNYDLTTYEITAPGSTTELLVTYNLPLINFPDWQGRLYKNRKGIEWQGKVHERIAGVKKYSFVPAEHIYSILHHKSIERQEKQNKLYAVI